ncbi:MAG: hypothetical protein FJX72_05355 [Armatimonadetes bacterium]|nr:hypothetical protein [Armatimonadota bacterium]
MLSRVTLGDTMALVCLGCLSCEGPQPLRMPARFLAMLAMPVPKFEVREPAPVPALSVCPTCGVTFADVTASGLLGCPGCYTAFAEAVEFGLARLHGSS